MGGVSCVGGLGGGEARGRGGQGSLTITSIIRRVTFFATSAQVLPALLIAFILEARGAHSVLKRRANWVPFGGRLYSWFSLLFLAGEAVALVMVAPADYGVSVSPVWRNTALVVVGLALLVFTHFVLQFAWLVSVDRLFPEDGAPTEESTNASVS